ncbi:unnamed protein product [Caenorhabditis angaria]|uniref:small monomeric GTPase n=1 Tax=Caenorhabditis angaria TaxID=860376 RepID=A0A9P1IPJ7_9PELO|nr:unnamed protein product [Caenorhabditis angaria]
MPGGPVIYRTPKCLVCGAAANQAAPIPNLELDNFLRNIKSFRWNGLDQTISTTKRRWEDEGFSIHECKIAVIGAKGVGKTCFARVQYSNEIMFPDMLNEMDDSDSYVIDIVDNMEMKKSFSAAHGIIIMYSIADRQSFYEAAEVYKQLEQGREHNQPIVLVGSKKDKNRRRQVTPFEGQQLARTLGCPFFEVSSKKQRLCTRDICRTRFTHSTTTIFIQISCARIVTLINFN